ncbi:MAG: YwaF family protein [Clostridia bacterium]|nr:YwaF family protein [Clostridia bacterium]
MKVLGAIINFLDFKITTPEPYGYLHLLFIALVIITTVILCVKFKNASQKVYERIILISWIIMVVFEAYKQFNFTFSYDGTTITGDYQWYAFPFQFCSTPLYVFPFIVFCKNERVKNAAIAFTMTFVLFAGLAVYATPTTIFVETLGINIQTLTHHGLQIVMGIFTAVYYREKLGNLKFFVHGTVMFLGVLIIAQALNLLAPLWTSETFNMFFISPHGTCELPILQDIQPLVPNAIFFIIYLVGFSLVALLVFGIETGIYKLVKHFKK